MKRAHNRILRHSAEMSPVAEHDSAYAGKHESLVDSIAEIFNELCEALDITAEFIAETVAENTAQIRKIAQKYLRKLQLPCPEFRPARWKYSGHFDAGIFDLPVIYDGKGLLFIA